MQGGPHAMSHSPAARYAVRDRVSISGLLRPLSAEDDASVGGRLTRRVGRQAVADW